MAFTRPSERYAEELRQVAEAADDLYSYLANQPNMLPIGFPSDAVITICTALRQLPEGSVEGSVPILDAGREQCPTIRRNFIPIEKEPSDPNYDPDQPPVFRGGDLDGLVNDLYVAIGTAIDAFKDEYGDGFEDGIEIDNPIKARPEFVLEAAIQNSRCAEIELSKYTTENKEFLENEEALKRGLVDADNELKAARSTAEMPEPKPNLLSRLGSYISKTPEALQAVGRSARVVADVATPMVESAVKIAVNGWKSMLDALALAGEGIEESGRRMAAWRDGQRNDDDDVIVSADEAEGAFQHKTAMEMIFKGQELPESWYPEVVEVNLANKGRKNWNKIEKSAEIISKCSNTKILDLTGSRFADFSFTSSLSDLVELRIGSTKVQNLDWCKGLDKLRNLHLHNATSLKNIDGIVYLENLSSLQMKLGQRDFDYSPLIKLQKLSSVIINMDDISEMLKQEIINSNPALRGDPSFFDIKGRRRFEKRAKKRERKSRRGKGGAYLR